MVKNLPARQEIHVRSLDWEDPLEKGMATHSDILAWRIPWTEEPGGLQSLGVTKIHKEDPPSFLWLHYILLCEETLVYLIGPLLMVLGRLPMFHNINIIAVNSLGPFDNIV